MKQRRKSCRINKNVSVADVTHHHVSVAAAADKTVQRCPACKCDPCDCGWGSYIASTKR